MKHLPRFPSILAIYCFCLLQSTSSGFPRPLADSPDGLDIMQLEDKQDMYKRFLFHYSRTQELTHPVKIGIPPVHPLMRLAAKLAHGKMKRFPPRDSGAAAVDFTKKDHTATWGRPFFLFRPRNGRNTEDNTQWDSPRSTHCSFSPPKFSGKGKLDQMKQPSNYFEQMSNFFL